MRTLFTLILSLACLVGSVHGQTKISEYNPITEPIADADIWHMYDMSASPGSRSHKVTAAEFKTYLQTGAWTQYGDIVLDGSSSLSTGAGGTISIDTNTLSSSSGILTLIGNGFNSAILYTTEIYPSGVSEEITSHANTFYFRNLANSDDGNAVAKVFTAQSGNFTATNGDDYVTMYAEEGSKYVLSSSEGILIKMQPDNLQLGQWFDGSFTVKPAPGWDGDHQDGVDLILSPGNAWDDTGLAGSLLLYGGVDGGVGNDGAEVPTTLVAEATNDQFIIHERLINRWLIKTTTYTAKAGEKIQANTAVAAWTLNLPGSPTVGDEVLVEDMTFTWGTNPLTISSADNKINGVGAPGSFLANVSGKRLTCVYTGETYGWTIK